MSGLDTADRIPMLAELIVPLTDFGYTGALLLGAGCFVTAVALVRVPARHVVARRLRDALAQTALIYSCWAAVSISLAYTWETAL
ncbi:hypothetical protein AB0F71_31090 [Kitasatospora sp. NPDC028055]|uniref:hypothetical protein n=1 Tax=Kitasatospora sp. NPDC028055 TaxID=3155653 RepID=UPI00340A5AE6